MSLKAFQQNLNRNLAWYVAASLGLGLLVGDLSGAFLDKYGASLSNSTTVVVFFMIYPMMVNLQVEALGKAMRNGRALLLSLAYNFLWAPLLGFLLSKVFLPDPLLAFGFMLVMVVPDFLVVLAVCRLRRVFFGGLFLLCIRIGWRRLRGIVVWRRRLS